MRCALRKDHPSVPPVRLLKAALLMALNSIRSDQHFCEKVLYR
jgi:transposase